MPLLPCFPPRGVRPARWAALPDSSKGSHERRTSAMSPCALLTYGAFFFGVIESSKPVCSIRRFPQPSEQVQPPGPLLKRPGIQPSDFHFPENPITKAIPGLNFRPIFIIVSVQSRPLTIESPYGFPSCPTPHAKRLSAARPFTQATRSKDRLSLEGNDPWLADHTLLMPAEIDPSVAHRVARHRSPMNYERQGCSLLSNANPRRSLGWVIRMPKCRFH
jgi:hypothetical protein